LGAVLEETDIPLHIEVNGKPAPSETTATSVGAYVLVIATVLADQAIDLYSTYAGHPHTNTIASHLLLAHGAYEAIAEEHEHDQLPVVHARRRCLYDHLHQLQDLLKTLGMQANIPVENAAIHAVER
jgi:hypothetical protein